MKKMLRLLALFNLLPMLSMAGTPPPTLMALAGVRPSPAALSESVVILIDGQREYVDGALSLPGIQEALAEGARLLKRARAAGTPVIHVVHRGSGSLFNPHSPYFAIAEPVTPSEGESVIEKRLPDGNGGTIPARVVQQASLAALADRFAVVVQRTDELPD